MKVIIAGSRDITDFGVVARAVDASGFLVREVVSGGARGVDQLGELWAQRAKLPSVRFLAAWGAYGKGAGFVRNEEMAKYADALVAIWDGKSKGTKHMIDTATKRGLKVYVYRVEPTPVEKPVERKGL